jgi:hypothetical protein
MESPSSDPKQKWREFEKLAANIQQQLAPEASVTLDARLPGKRSGIERQIDILVEQTVGQFPIRIVVDCKDYNHPLDVKDIETFMGLVEDVSANKGAIIAASGFTSTAKKRAKDAGIDLYRFVDTEHVKWRSYVSIPCVVRDRCIELFSFTFQSTGYCRMAGCDPRHTCLYRADGNRIDCLHNLVIEAWESGRIPSKPGRYEKTLLTSGDTYIKTDDVLYQVTVLVNATVGEKLYFGQVPLSDASGLHDEINGVFHTKGFSTAPLDLLEVERTWERISSISQLAVKPVLELGVKSTQVRIGQPAEPTNQS